MPKAHKPTDAPAYRGVSWNDRVGKWKIWVWFNGKNHTLTIFDDPEAAARTRDQILLLIGRPVDHLQFKDFRPHPDFPIGKVIEIIRGRGWNLPLRIDGHNGTPSQPA